MSETVYDIVTGVEVGLSLATNTKVKNIMSFADRLVGRDGDMVEPLVTINYPVPRGVHQNQKLYHLQLVLDSFNHTAFYDQRVNSSGASTRAIRQGLANDPIDWFAVYIREEDGTDKRWLYDADKVWVTNLVHEYTNEPEVRNKPTTIDLMCLGEKTTTDNAFSGNDTTGLAHFNTDSVVTPLGTVSNILRVREEYIMGADPRFVPNVYQGIAMKFNHEWRELTLTFDSDVSIFDSYINDIGINNPLPSLRINHTMTDIATQNPVDERWDYTANKIWVMDRNEGRVTEGSERKTFEYKLIAIGDKTTTFS